MSRKKKTIISNKLQIRCSFCGKLFVPDFAGIGKSPKSRNLFWGNLENAVCPFCGKQRGSPKKEPPAYRARGQV